MTSQGYHQLFYFIIFNAGPFGSQVAVAARMIWINRLSSEAPTSGAVETSRINRPGRSPEGNGAMSDALPHAVSPSMLPLIVYRVAQKKRNSRFFGLCSDQQLSFFTLLDRASFPHYNNTKIIEFGWELFILWVISYGLSFSGFAIDLSLIVPRNSGNRANPENDSPYKEITHKIKNSQPNLVILVLL